MDLWNGLLFLNLKKKKREKSLGILGDSLVSEIHDSSRRVEKEIVESK